MNENDLFWFCALLGTGLFAIQFLLSVFGNFDQEDLEASTVDAFQVKWLSKQALTGFLMLFGWSALTCKHQFGLSLAPTLAIALAAGVATVLINGSIFKLARKLHSPGSKFDIAQTLGLEAVVYQRIPKGGVGKISLSLHNMTFEIDALSLDSEEIPSFAPVKVIQQANENTVIVTPI
jgi:hypothetical protein